MSNDTESRIWKVTKQVFTALLKISAVIFGIVLAITVGVFKLIYEIAHINDEDYQNRKRLEEEYRRKTEWIEKATGEELLNDWRLKASGMRPESHEEAEVIGLIKSNPKSLISSLLSQQQRKILVLMILRVLGSFS
jgi:hypothetical protein